MRDYILCYELWNKTNFDSVTLYFGYGRELESGDGSRDTVA